MCDFAYPASRKVSSKATVADDSNVVEVMGFKVVCWAEKNVIDLDAVATSGRQWSEFDINNRLGVWKLMTMMEKEKIKNACTEYGDRAVMWHDGKHDVGIYFSDLKSLICPASVRGNVIDAYAILLMEEQE
ncbi:hypothetical protein CsSME_00016546 [Camellia sinensis var. sinensis]